jgi:hypothetical protein
LVAGHVAQPATKVGPHEVFRLVARLRRDFEQPPIAHEWRTEVTVEVDLGMNRIEGCGVVASKFELCRSAIRAAGASHADAGWRA